MIVDTPLNKNRESLILLIGYVAIHDPDMQKINRRFWSLSCINHTKNIIESIPSKEIFAMLKGLNYKAIYHKLSGLEYKEIHHSEMLLLSSMVPSITDIESSWYFSKEAFFVVSTSIALLFFSKKFQQFPLVRQRLPFLREILTKETVGLLALSTIVVAAGGIVAYQQQISNAELNKKLKSFQDHDSPAETISYLYKMKVTATHNVASSITSDQEIEEKKQQYQQQTQTFKLW
jgi:hypothetical protein